MELDLGNAPVAKNGIRRRAATEGRPYSTFRKVSLPEAFRRRSRLLRLAGRSPGIVEWSEKQD